MERYRNLEKERDTGAVRMSYIRSGHPLKYFKGESTAYVYGTVVPKKKKARPYNEHPEDYEDKVIDYEAMYTDNATFAELIIRIMSREIKDEEWLWNITQILAKKLRISHKLRDHPLTWEEWNIEHEKIMKKFHESKAYKEMEKIFDEQKTKRRNRKKVARV